MSFWLPGRWGRPQLLRKVYVLAVVVAGCLMLVAVSQAPVRPIGRRTVAGGAGAKVGFVSLPASLQAAASSRLGAQSRRFAIARIAGRGLIASGGGLSTVFGRSGPVVRADLSVMGLSLVGIGRQGSVSKPVGAPPSAEGNQVSYRRGDVAEWYRNGPAGLEMGFILQSRPQ